MNATLVQSDHLIVQQVPDVRTLENGLTQFGIQSRGIVSIEDKDGSLWSIWLSPHFARGVLKSPAWWTKEK